MTPRYCEADPFEGGKQAVAEVWRNLSAVGAQPLAMTDNLNFGNPERPEIMGQLVGCIDGIAAAAAALSFPVVSGNVSLYNETDGRAIPPTPTIGGVGLLADWKRSATLAFKADGEIILLIGNAPQWLGRSMYLQAICGREEGAPPPVDLALERAHGDFVRAAIAEGWLTAVHDVADGGLLLAIAEMAMASGIGAICSRRQPGWWRMGFGLARTRPAISSPLSRVDWILCGRGPTRPALPGAGWARPQRFARSTGRGADLDQDAQGAL